MGLALRDDDGEETMSDEEALALFQAQLEALETKARQVAQDTWGLMPEDPEGRAAYIEQVLTETAGVLGDQAGEAGRQYVINHRAANGYEDGDPTAAERDGEWITRKRRREVERRLVANSEEDARDYLERQIVAIVLSRARTTVVDSARKVGNAWCRVPERMACWFCLMLASRGAVYKKDTVLATKSGMSRYHSHCRCTAAEVFNEKHMPALTQACVDYRQRTGSFDKDSVTTGDFTRVTGVLSSTLEQDDDARLGVSRLPEWFTPAVVEPEALLSVWPEPSKHDLDVMIDGKKTGRAAGRRQVRGAHGHGAGAPYKTEFPEGWTRQDVYRATLLTMLDPQLAQIDGDRRTYRRDVHGVIVEVSWYMSSKTGRMTYRHTIPKAGDGVMKNDANGVPRTAVPYDLDLLTTRVES